MQLQNLRNGQGADSAPRRTLATASPVDMQSQGNACFRWITIAAVAGIARA